MREFVPTCPLCGARAVVRRQQAGFVHWSFGYLCDACVARVRTAGPAQVRQIRVLSARVDALVEAYPMLHVTERARRRVAIEGEVRGRRVWLTLKTAPREYEDERYVFRAELIRDCALEGDVLHGMSELLRTHLSRAPPAVVVDRFRHVRVSFRHLGRIDVVHAVDQVVALAERWDRAADPVG